jgi:hypothetical protein
MVGKFNSDEIMRLANQPGHPENKRVDITVEKIRSIGSGRFKVKVAETKERLIDMRIDGRNFIVTRSLGRGRYVVRERRDNVAPDFNG